MAEELPPEGAEPVGSVNTAIGIEYGRVIVVWPKAITWVSFDPDGADLFADTLRLRAQQCREMQAREVALTKH